MPTLKRAKPLRRRRPAEEEMDIVTVVNCDEMNDEVFIKHLNARHAGDPGVQNVTYMPLSLPSYHRTLRAFHERLHDISLPGQYSHDHEVE